MSEIAKMLDYLIEAVERVTPEPHDSDPAEQSGAYYLGQNLKVAKAMAESLRSASAFPHETYRHREAAEAWLHERGYNFDDVDSLVILLSSVWCTAVDHARSTLNKSAASADDLRRRIGTVIWAWEKSVVAKDVIADLRLALEQHAEAGIAPCASEGEQAERGES